MSDPGEHTEPTGEAYDVDLAFPEQDEPERRERTPVTARGVALFGARTVAGLAGLAIAAATITASAVIPLPGIEVTPASTVVTPVPTAQQLVCPGAVLRLSDDSGQGATISSAIGEPSVVSGASSGSVDSAPLTLSDAGTGDTDAAPTVISTPPNPDDPQASILLSGAQSQQVTAGDFVGLAAADCAVPTGDSWLAAGSTTVGRTALLSLANSSEVAATVTLELFGENGAITAPGTSGIIVPAGGQRVLSLAGFAPDVASPVVHVISTGGLVAASLQQAIVRGLTPGGVDVVGSTAGLSEQNVIPGVLVTDLASTRSLLSGGGDYLDTETVLRIFAPATGTDTAAVPVTVSVVPENATDTGTSFELDITAGVVVDVPIQDLGTGSYTVRVDSEAPAVAAVRVTSAAGPASDFGWFTPSEALDQTAQVTIPAGPSPQLHLTNPGASEALVTLTPVGGVVSTFALPAGASAGVAVIPGATYTLSGFDTIYAAVSLAGGGMIAGYPVHPPGIGSTPITVYP